jgi:hypothetical protein
VWKQPGFPIKKKDEQKTKILPTLLLQDGIFTRDVGVRERDQSQKAKSFTRRKEGGGESGFVIVTGRITSAINKNREVVREGREPDPLISPGGELFLGG